MLLQSMIPDRFRVAVFSALACFAFASNSILCRLALREDTIDAGSFTVVRLISGAAALWLILILSGYRKKQEYSGSWLSAWMLFLYAIAFSFAYIGLHAGTGALILFGAVQITMISTGIIKGERPHPMQYMGLLLAFGGLAYLVFPGFTSPPLLSSSLMTVAGFAWGIYSIRGRGNKHPVAVTTDNFIRTIPFALITGLIFLSQVHITPSGFLWATISGAVTSGVGYIIWYAALRGLTATRAAIIQLSVPVIAAFGGIIVLSESITLRLILSAALTLSGVAIAVISKQRR
jgi:drug/metabolite transporter (DMT)-like permease